MRRVAGMLGCAVVAAMMLSCTGESVPPAGPSASLDDTGTIEATRSVSITATPERGDPPPGERERLHATWSPDGSRLGYFAPSASGYSLEVMDAEGRKARELAAAGAIPYPPVWSPDGVRIAFAASADGVEGASILIVSLDDRAVQSLGDPAYIGDFPSWSPDGESLAFLSDFEGSPAVYRAGLDGSGLTRLTDDALRADRPTWLPDGRIAIAGRAGMQWDLYVMDANGGGLRRLTDDASGDVVYPSGAPLLVSSDGRWIAFDSVRDGNREVYLAPVGGGKSLRVTDDPGVDVPVSWSPDGRHLLIVSNRAGERGFWAWSGDDRSPTVLPDAAGPDGRWWDRIVGG